MRVRGTRFGVLVSTGGAVLARLLTSAWFRDHLAVVVADRPCGAIECAERAGVPTVVVDEPDAYLRERALADVFDAHGADHILLFYTRLLRHDLLVRRAGTLWNLHPSLLPAFPGRHGFEDAIAAGARVLGTTLHAVDAGCDTGPVLLQTVFARDPGASLAATRHRLFEQQVRAALQACRWLAAGRVAVVEGRVVVRDEPAPILLAGTLYAPGLDDAEAHTVVVPAFVTAEVAS
ncbi:MAG: phosphoribosylglycinamide formyltransferase [bacterium]